MPGASEIYDDFSRRKGKNNTALIRLKTASNVRPTRRNGSRISQRSGYKTIISKAKGQHNTSSINQSVMEMNVLIRKAFMPVDWQRAGQFL